MTHKVLPRPLFFTYRHFVLHILGRGLSCSPIDGLVLSIISQSMPKNHIFYMILKWCICNEYIAEIPVSISSHFIVLMLFPILGNTSKTKHNRYRRATVMLVQVHVSTFCAELSDVTHIFYMIQRCQILSHRVNSRYSRHHLCRSTWCRRTGCVHGAPFLGLLLLACDTSAYLSLRWVSEGNPILQTSLGSLLLTWLNLNPSMDK